MSCMLCLQDGNNRFVLYIYRRYPSEAHASPVAVAVAVAVAPHLPSRVPSPSASSLAVRNGDTSSSSAPAAAAVGAASPSLTAPAAPHRISSPSSHPSPCCSHSYPLCCSARPSACVLHPPPPVAAPNLPATPLMAGPGDELAELLWDHGPALRRPPPFQPFTCSAAGSSRSQELKRHAADASTTTKAAAFVTPVAPLPLAGMHGAGLGLGGLPIHDDDDDAVPWLHCPVVDDGDADTAPLPPEYCASLLSDYSGPAPASHAAAVVPAAPPPPEPVAANKLAPPSAAAGGGAGEGVVNFTFFSRPLQRPQAAASAAATASQHVESTVVQAATNRLRSTPLFSEQRMAWLQPPKAPRATAAAETPPPPLPPPLAPLLPDIRRGETVAQPLSQPEARPPPDAAAATTSSVCSGNGDRSQLKRSSHLAADCSVSPDEDLDLDDEPGATRRSAARSGKRSRTAEVHNLSERRRRDRINEKMRALQELIPNCNKIDKASMLEEAIEYLKTLQLQVQMMSMGTGLCMPPAMLLPAMHQHLQALHHHPMAHFPHLGMGLGYGMGMGVTAAAPGYDMLPRVAAGAHFPCTPMAMPPPGGMFGVPGQAIPSMPAAFAHMAGAAPAGQMEAAAGAGAGAAAAAPARPGEAEHPPVLGVAQGDQEGQQPKQT